MSCSAAAAGDSAQVLQQDKDEQEEEVKAEERGDDKEDASKAANDKETEDKEEEEDVDAEGWQDLLGSGRLKKRLLKEGEGGEKGTEEGKVRQGDEARVAVEVRFQVRKSTISNFCFRFPL